jgi:outer membrane lipopolysaccharide assembly protein LptE/RlpB
MKFLYIILLSFVLGSCWPTQFLSINDSGGMPEEWKTFFVETIESTAATAPNFYPAGFSEDLRLGIQNNTRLKLENTLEKADVKIKGTINSYNTSPIAIQQGDVANQNRLTIGVNFVISTQTKGLETINLNASRFADYNSNQSLTDVENELIKAINQQLVQDLVNKLQSNW